MKAKELRLDNLIRHIALGDNVKVSQVTKYFISADGITFNLEEFEPIPLTKEWLLKFGFEYKESDIYIIITGKFIIAVGSDGSYGLCNNKDSWDRGESFNNREILNHVHQLQNLYFALTGEELEIK
tara:strand:+ start:311 stop:688 length:378 start_codon:yes stop_codon:yes gene_type:complete